jgi:ATP-binding cassette subfamily F protein uup
LLEEILCEFKGTVLLVSHDRAFLDNVVTSTLVFNGNGKISEFVGGYEDWIRQGGVLPKSEMPQDGAATDAGPGAGSASSGAQSALTSEPLTSGPSAPVPAPASKPAAKKPVTEKPVTKKPVTKKLSYKLQRELDQLPATLERLEQQLETLQQATGATDFYQQPHDVVAERLAAVEACEHELELAMERWVELEAMQ